MTPNIPRPDAPRTLTSLLALLLTGLVLVAAPHPARAAPDQDGRFPITVEERDAHRAEIFALVDTNGDGLISSEEFAAADLPARPRGPQQSRWGGRYQGAQGSNGHARQNGAMAAMEEDLFLALDADADGVISRDEFSAAAMGEARRAARKSRFFARADADGDGYLSPEEFPPRRLATLDANGDGEIDADEWPDRRRDRYRDGNAG